MEHFIEYFFWNFVENETFHGKRCVKWIYNTMEKDRANNDIVDA